jgi:hypothetical protein
MFNPVEPLLCNRGVALDRRLEDRAEENTVDPSKSEQKEWYHLAIPVNPRVFIVAFIIIIIIIIIIVDVKTIIFVVVKFVGHDSTISIYENEWPLLSGWLLLTFRGCSDRSHSESRNFVVGCWLLLTFRGCSSDRIVVTPNRILVTPNHSESYPFRSHRTVVTPNHSESYPFRSYRSHSKPLRIISGSKPLRIISGL